MTLTSSSAAPPSSALSVIAVSLGVTMGTMGVVGLMFSAPEPSLGRILALAAFYCVMTAVTCLRLARRGEVREQLMPRSGDLAVGFGIAAALYIAAMLIQSLLSDAQQMWLLRIYILLGDPSVSSYHLVAAMIFVIAALEEVVWRGLVMRMLEERLGSRRGWLLSTALYGLAHLPTVWLLSAPRAGPNPLIGAAAFGCGLVWGFAANRTQRLAPAVFAHALFTWAVVEFPLWRP